MDQKALRLLIRNRLQSGQLPYDGVSNVSSSPASREICAACETAIADEQLVTKGMTKTGMGQNPSNSMLSASDCGTTSGAGRARRLRSLGSSSCWLSRDPTSHSRPRLSNGTGSTRKAARAKWEPRRSRVSTSDQRAATDELGSAPL